MRSHRREPDERPGLITRLAIATLAYLGAILLGVLAAANDGGTD